MAGPEIRSIEQVDAIPETPKRVYTEALALLKKAPAGVTVKITAATPFQAKKAARAVRAHLQGGVSTRICGAEAYITKKAG